MYGKEVSEALEKRGIRVGDTISVSAGHEGFEGVLMPRADVGDSSVLVIKRKDGYNIGVKYRKSMKLARLVQGKGEFAFPKAAAAGRKGMSRVGLIYTGGTIGSKVDYHTGGVYMLTKPEELLFEVPELQDIANISVFNLMSIASEDMASAEWAAIGKEVVAALNGGAKGVIITHGTDTMHYTAAALSFMLQDVNAPVILTGAQRSSDRGSSDAFMNLACSAHLAARSDIAEVGICMHYTSSDATCSFLRGVKARKMHTSRRDAFRPVNGSPIAMVDASGKIEYRSAYRKVQRSGTKASLLARFDDKTALVKFHPNSDPGIIDYYVGKGCKGMVIEGTGLGHVAVSPSRKEQSWIGSIREAVGSGVVVGMASQCLYGRVNPTVYRNLRLAAAAGAIYCEDMLPEVAYVKLGFLLGNYGAQKARQALAVDIAGEITKRTEYMEELW